MANADQGELFADFAPKPVEKPSKSSPIPQREKETTHIAQKVDISRYPKPKTFYTYDEYLKIHCGNHAAAEYWWKRLMKKIESEGVKRCHG